MKFEISRPQAGDIPHILRLWKEQYDFHYELDPTQYGPFTDELKARVEAALHKMLITEEAHILVAKKGDGLIGFVTFEVEDDNYYDAAVSRYGVIKEVLVTENARRRGIGAALTVAARDNLFHKQGMTQVKIQYATNNEGARATYASIGARPAQEIAIFTKPEGE